MYFTICSAEYITYHADAHTRAIFSHSHTRDAIYLSIEGLVTAGVTEPEFTRSIALIARRIADDLELKQAQVGHQFAACLAGAAVSVFLSYWTDQQRRFAPGYCPNRIADAVDPRSLCAFIGDLFSLRILTFAEFDDCVSTLLSTTTTSFLFKCLHALIARGSGPTHPKMTSGYLFQLIASIKSMCAVHRNIESLEATKLMTLVYDIIFRIDGCIPQYKIDPCLDLDSALMESSMSPLAHWFYDSNAYAPISPEPRTPSSASSSLSSSESSMSCIKSYNAKCERRQTQDNSPKMTAKPRSIRSPPNPRPSFFPATHMHLLLPSPPTASPPPPVPYMPHQVSALQWVDDYFHDFVSKDTKQSLKTKSIIASIWANT